MIANLMRANNKSQKRKRETTTDQEFIIFEKLSDTQRISRRCLKTAVWGWEQCVLRYLKGKEHSVSRTENRLLGRNIVSKRVSKKEAREIQANSYPASKTKKAQI